MKTAIVASLFAIVSFSALASESVVVEARKLSCPEVQTILSEEKEIQIPSRNLGNITHYSSYPSCNFGERAAVSYTRTADRRFCRVGYTCSFDLRGVGEL